MKKTQYSSLQDNIRDGKIRQIRGQQINVGQKCMNVGNFISFVIQIKFMLKLDLLESIESGKISLKITTHINICYDK